MLSQKLTQNDGTNIITPDEFKVKQTVEWSNSTLNMTFTMESIRTISINTWNCKSNKITNQTYS